MYSDHVALFFILAFYLAISTIYVFIFIDEILLGILFTDGFGFTYLFFFPSLIVAYLLLGIFYLLAILLIAPILLFLSIFTNHLDL